MESVSSDAIALASLMATKMLTEALVSRGTLSKEEAVQAWEEGARQLESVAHEASTDLNIQAGRALRKVASDMEKM
jgi:polyhydroxyalkanoate synthesis regulator phasin